MPCGLVRTDLNRTGISFRDGSPTTLPHDFGNDVTWTIDPAHFGNPVPPTDPSFNSNPVTWSVDPSHFGNIIGGGVVANILLLADTTAILLTDGTNILLVP